MPSLVANSIAMLAARLAVPFFSFGINIGVARLLGSHVLGQYVELVALLLVAQALAGGGLSMLVTRDVAAHPDERAELMQRANRVGFASGLLATVLFLAYARIVLPPDVWNPALLLGASILPSAWISAQEGLFMGLHQHPRITLVAFVEGAVKLAAAGAVFAVDGGLAGLCAGLTVARLVALGLGHGLTVRAGVQRAFGRPGRVLEFARALVPFAAIFTLGILYFRQDVLVVGALRSETETGLYGIATTLYALTLLAPNSVMSAVFPRLAAAFGSARSDYHEATMLTSKLLTVEGVVVALVLIAAAPLLVRTLYGPPFLAAVPTLALLAAVLPLHGANAALGQAMQAAHLQGEMLALTIGAVAVNLVLCLVLVPQMGILGAALALLTTSSLSAVVLAWIYHRRITPFRLGVRAALVPITVAAPVLVALASPETLRPAAAAGGLVLLAAGARVSGLLSGADLSRLAAGLRLGAARAENQRA
ncbi:MAG: oligosaccharide flippase family protein [Deltaproteobacteria bacterium]|nr:oligosaccharide flippase family protein [Deltaproteobacteria bacterium]